LQEVFDPEEAERFLLLFKYQIFQPFAKHIGLNVNGVKHIPA